MSIATVFGASMAQITGNAGGAVQAYPAANLVLGKVRSFAERITLAAQTAGTIIGVARIRVPFVLLSVFYQTDTSLGSTTIALGNANTTAQYVAAQALTTTNQKVAPTGLVTANFATQINTGYDCTTGNQVTPQAPGQGGGGYEDFVITTAAATAPASGSLIVYIEAAFE